MVVIVYWQDYGELYIDRKRVSSGSADALLNEVWHHGVITVWSVAILEDRVLTRGLQGTGHPLACYWTVPSGSPWIRGHLEFPDELDEAAWNFLCQR